MEESEQQRLRSGHDVFVSYAVEDKPIADALVARLEANHIRCWFAPRDVLPGLSWASAIVDAINQSRLMVLVYSSQSNQSNQVRREVERAASRGIPILPFRIEDVPPSKDMEYFISSSHWLDALTPPLERHLQHLSETVSLLLARQVGPQVQELPEASNAATTAKPPTDAFIKKDRNRRVLMIVGGSAAVLAIVATSAVFAARGWKGGTGKTITSTPVPTAQAASLAPTLAPTPVPTPKAATNAIPVNSPGPVLYSDDFSDPSRGLFLDNQQGTGKTTFNNGATAQYTWQYRYQDGALVGSVTGAYPLEKADQLFPSSAQSKVNLFDDFAIEVRTRATISPGQVQYGIYYRVSTSEYWQFNIREPGHSYQVWSRKAQRSLASGQTPTLNPLDEENVLRMEIRGNEMRVFINGQEVDRIRDDSLKKPGGAAGLNWAMTSQTADGQIEVRFTYFKVYSLSSPATATATPPPNPTGATTTVATPGPPGQLLASDDFSNASKGLFLDNQQGAGRVTFDNGTTAQYTWEYRYQDGALVQSVKGHYPVDKPSQVMVQSVASAVKVFDDFAVEVRARVTRSPGQVQYGINYQAQQGEKWAFVIREPGRSYFIWSEKTQRSVSGGQNIALQPFDRENVLRMEVRGDEMRVFINGREVDRVKDDGLKKRGGTVGLEFGMTSQTSDDQVEIHFTDFKVYSLSASPTPSATALQPAALKGPLAYEAKLNGNADDVTLPRWIINDPAASDVRFTPGSIDFVILKRDGNTGVNLNTGARLRYLIESDLSVEPGADLWAGLNIRWGSKAQNAGYVIRLNAVNEYMEFVYQPNDNPGGVVRMGPLMVIPGLQTGRTFRITVAADAGRYIIFLDDKQVADISDSRLQEPTIPGVWAAGAKGTVHVRGIRIYQLQTAGTPTPTPAASASTPTATPAAKVQPVINNVSPIIAAQTQTITISGRGFGSRNPYVGDSDYLTFTDISAGGWAAGCPSCGVTLNVSSWTENQILVYGLAGQYGSSGWVLTLGDEIRVQVWNPQNAAAGPASYSILVSAALPGGQVQRVVPVITSVSPIIAAQNQTITISGKGFGARNSYNYDSAFLRFSDVTTGWMAGGYGSAVPLNVASWSDNQIVVSGFAGQYGSSGWVLTLGDEIRIDVWNPLSAGAGPASYSTIVSASLPPGQTPPVPTTPIITGVSPIIAAQTQTIAISGRGFGSRNPYNGTSAFLMFNDLSAVWMAGGYGSGISLNVTNWTDNQIVVSGFTGRYGSSGWVLSLGDEIRIQVWNPQFMGAGSASYSIVVAADVLPGQTQPAPPVITRVSPIFAAQTQTITISGKGFGSRNPYNGNSAFLKFSDARTGWSAGAYGSGVMLNVTSWNDSQIVVSGFTGQYGTNGWVLNSGDQIQIQVWNPQFMGAGAASYSTSVSAGPLPTQAP